MFKIILIVSFLDSILCILAASPANLDNNHLSGSHHNRSSSSDDSDHSDTSTPRSYHSTASSFNSPKRSKSPKRRQQDGIVWHGKGIVERHDLLEWHDKHIPRDKHVNSSHNFGHLSASSSNRTRPQINEISTLSAGHLTRSPPISPHPSLSMHASTSQRRGARERGISIHTSNSPRQRATSTQSNHHNTVEQPNTSTRTQSPPSLRDPLPSLNDQDYDSFWRAYHLINEATRRVPGNQSFQNHQENQNENHSYRPNLNVSPSDHRRTQVRQSAANWPQTASNSRTSHIATSLRQRREIECSDSPSPEDKHVIKSKPTSPSSSSSKQTSPQRIWEDKHVVNEHVSTNQAQRSSSISPSRISTTNVHTHAIQQPALQATHHYEQHTGMESNENAIPQTTSSPQSSHGSPIRQEDIRARLRSSRRPRSPQENYSSRINERQSKHQKNRYKRANQRKF